MNVSESPFKQRLDSDGSWCYATPNEGPLNQTLNLIAELKESVLPSFYRPVRSNSDYPNPYVKPRFGIIIEGLNSESSGLHITSPSFKEITTFMPIQMNDYSEMISPGTEVNLVFQAFSFDHQNRRKYFVPPDMEHEYLYDLKKIQKIPRFNQMREDTIVVNLSPTVSAPHYYAYTDSFLMGLQKIGALLALFRIAALLRFYH